MEGGGASERLTTPPEPEKQGHLCAEMIFEWFTRCYTSNIDL